MASIDPVSLSVAVRPSAPIQFTHQIHTSLTHENFLLWKSQVLPVLRGHGLASFLDGSRSPPPQFQSSTAGVQLINPEYETWHQQDQLILAWLFSSISSSALSQVARCDTSASLWNTLIQIHFTQSMAKILDLKLQLQTIKKGGDSCSEFLQKIQLLADRLRSIGTDLSDHDLVLHALQGLGSDYDSFVTAISMRSEFPSMLELTGLLLSHETRHLSNLRSSFTTAVHLTTTPTESASSQPDPMAYYSNSKPRSSDSTQHNFNFTNRGRGRGRFQQRGRGCGRSSNQSSGHYSYQTNSTADPSLCQICNKRGHNALNCYHRFDIRYTASPDPPQALLAEPSALPFSPSNQLTPLYIDSGASTHVTSDLNNLTSSQPYHGPKAVHIGNGLGLSIAHKGSAIIHTFFKPLILHNVLHVPAITKNLLSISQLILDNHVTVEFSSNSCFVKDQATQTILLHGILHKGLYKIIPINPSPQHQVSLAHASSLDVWHFRLAHCSQSVLDSLRKAQTISIKPSSFSFCTSCTKAKAHKLPFIPSVTSASRPLEVVHSDLWGPAPTVLQRGNRYYVIFIDEYTRFSWLYPCACKSDVSSIFAHFKLRVENLLSSKIKIFQIDGGTEFKPLMRTYPEITFRLSCPHTPEQNGLSKRKHRHVVELGLANLFHASIPLQFWDLIFESVVYVINRLPSLKNGTVSPFEELFAQKPNYTFMHILGCAYFPLLRPYNLLELCPRSQST